ncbi:MAG: hypothetical protein WKF85_04125 [Chitinophagaceae bacterium]
MDKILISTNEQDYNHAISKIQLLKKEAEKLDIIIQQYTGAVLTQEVYTDVLFHKGSQIKENYKQQLEADIKKLKITSPKTIQTMMAGVKEFAEEIYFYIESLRGDDRMKYASYLSIQEGKAVVKQEALDHLYEEFKNYASTPEEIELYNAQKEACESLNKLLQITKKNFPGLRFNLPMNFYTGFFDFSGNSIEVKPILFDLLTAQHSKQTVEEINKYKQAEKEVKDQENKKILDTVHEKLPVVNASHRTADISNSILI